VAILTGEMKGKFFTESNVAPFVSKNPSATYYSFKNIYEEFGKSEREIKDYIVQRMLKRKSPSALNSQLAPKGRDMCMHSSTMGEFTWSINREENYISYYDRWDFTGSAGVIGCIMDWLGVPFEIYGRLYYDPKQYAPQQDAQRELALK
jgi:hypothetical protein